MRTLCITMPFLWFKKASIIATLLTISILGYCQPAVTFSRIPSNLQLYPRNQSNQAIVPLTGQITTSGFTSVSLVVYKDNSRWYYQRNPLIYQNGRASFFFYPTLEAGLHEYYFRLYAKTSTDSVLIAQRDSVVCGDVYLITGQSNARLSDDKETYRNQFCRTFGKTTANGNAVASNLADTLWTYARANGFTNVGVWPLNLQRQLVEKHHVPICIINGGVSQTRIQMHLKNASSPSFYTDSYYGRLYYRALKSGLINNIKAIFWYQGESNAMEDFDTYLSAFNQLYFDWMNDYPNLKKIYLFQINVGCTSNHLSGQFREGQRQLKNLFPNVQTFATVATPGYDGCHYDTAGYKFISRQVYRAVAKDFYNAAANPDDYSPEIVKAYYTSTSYKELILEFSNASQLRWQNDTLGNYLTNYFYLNNLEGLVSSGYASGNTVRLILKQPFIARTISYLPNQPATSPFQGPFLRNRNKLGAFSFYNFPIEGPPLVGKDPGCPGAFGPIRHIFGTNRKNTTGSPIVRNTFWRKDTIYVLHDYVRIASGVTLTIEPGTIVMGAPFPFDTSMLIVQKGGRLIANGTAKAPIVFTSCKLQGTRNRGDWGGVVICGDAPNNAGNNIELEGGFKAFHGGSKATDNSGSLQYVRIEFAGIKFNNTEETNGLTLASVGSETNVRYVQVSFSNDDSFEWFGGTVNTKNIISWKPLDDDFDTDLGYKGNNQFGLGFRDYAVADISGSSGFESDNNRLFPEASPITSPIFSNFETWGPRLRSETPCNNFFRAGAHLSSKTEIKFYNTLFLGWQGDSIQKKATIYMEDAGTVEKAKIDSLRFRNCILGSYLPNYHFLAEVPSTSWAPFLSMKNWFHKIANKDSTSNNIMLPEKKAPFREIPLFTISSTNSRFIKGSSFRTGTLPALKEQPSGFFQNVSYRGAFGGTDWTAGWTEFNPNLVVYAANNYATRHAAESLLYNLQENNSNPLELFPNPAQESLCIQLNAPEECIAKITFQESFGRYYSKSTMALKEGQNLLELSLYHLPKGIYIVHIEFGNTLEIRKLIKN